MPAFDEQHMNNNPLYHGYDMSGDVNTPSDASERVDQLITVDAHAYTRLLHIVILLSVLLGIACLYIGFDLLRHYTTLFNQSATREELEKGSDDQFHDQNAPNTIASNQQSSPHTPFSFSAEYSTQRSPIPKGSDYSPHSNGVESHSLYSTPSNTTGSSVQSDGAYDFQEIVISNYMPDGPRAWIVTRESASLVPAPVDPGRLSALGITEERSHSQSSLYTIAEASHESSSATTPCTQSPPSSADSAKQTF